MKKLLLASLALVGMTTVAQAAEPAFRISHGGLRYSIMNSESKVDSNDAGKVKRSQLETMYGPWEIAVFHEGWAFYAEPAQMSRVGIGKEVSPGIEVGLKLGLMINNETEGKTEESKHTFAPYLSHTMDMGSMILESNLEIGYGMGASKKPNATTGSDDKTKTSEMSFALSTGPYWAIGKNFEVGAGIGFTYMSSEETEGKLKTTGTKIDIVLQQWRYKF